MSVADLFPLLNSIMDRLGQIESNLGISATSSSTSSSAVELPRSIRAFDSYTASALDPFVAACDKLGGDAAVGGALIKAIWGEMREFLLMAASCKEPTPNTPATMAPHLEALYGKVKEISKVIQRNQWEKHMKTISEGVGCVNWLVVKPAPRDFIETFIGGSDYWANGIRKEFKGVNPDQIAFCDTFKALISELMAYVKEFHTTGVAWNPKGVEIAEYKAGGGAAASAAPVTSAPVVGGGGGGGGASSSEAASKAAPNRADLFASLSKEGEITRGLKTVTKDMQTWRAEYKGGEAPAPTATKPKVAPRVAETPKGPAKLEFQAGTNKWVVENQSGPTAVTIGDKKETVYIFGCIGATVTITGKCKSIVVDSCKRTKVFFDSAFASVEVVNCQRMEVHVGEKVSAVAIDKTDGIVVYLPTTSLDTEVVASKSSEMNISWPDESGEMLERPIPEQYVHRIRGTTITADVSDLYSH